jgi:putative membrane protein
MPATGRGRSRVDQEAAACATLPPNSFTTTAIAELRTKSGAEFDKAYADHEVAYHQAVLDALNQTLIPAIQNPELNEFVEKVGPAFLGHLEAAKQLQKKVG